MQEPTEDSISSIGYDLLNHAQEFGQENRLPLTTQLFPFLLLASRRMTTREMSTWLDQSKGVKLSAAGISKGLQRPDLHLRRIAEHVEPLAAYISAVHYHENETPESILMGQDPRSGRSIFDLLDDITARIPDGRSEGIEQAFATLREVWAPIPEEVKFMCRPYFTFAQAPQPEDPED